MILQLVLSLALQAPAALDREVQLPVFPQTPWVQLPPSERRLGEDGPEGLGWVFTNTAGEEHNWRSSAIATPYLTERPLPGVWSLGTFRAELVAVMRMLESSPRFSDGNGPLLRGRLLEELGGLLADVQARVALSGTEGSIDLAHDDHAFDRRFEPVPAVDFGDGGRIFVSDTVFFPARKTQVILALDRRESEDMEERAVPFKDYATIEQAVEFRAVCARVVAMLGKALQPGLERAAARLSEIDSGWTNYLEHGFSQYPWESWANGWWTDFSWTRPPRSQWVLLHPELGLILDTRSSRSAEMETALLIHGVGYVHYGGDEREWFVGASATASITDDPSYGWGFGPSVHFGHTRLSSRVPHLSVSLLWQDFEDGDDGPVLAATLDLWRLVDRGSEALYQSRLAR